MIIGIMKTKNSSMRCNWMQLSASVLLTLLFVSTPSKAQVVNAYDAKQTAIDFLETKKSSSSKREVKQLNGALSEAITLSDDGKPAIHIFNRENGGYIIVSGELGTTHQVLAYSDTGKYNPDSIPVQMKEVIDGYISGISRLRKSSAEEKRIIEQNLAMERIISTANAYTNTDMPDHVDPLLGDIAWNQYEPYNYMTPTYGSDHGIEHYVTGCTATAVAQIMKYHEWPKQGRGSFSYEWNNQTLSADFSNSTYRWDLMLPKYYERGQLYTVEQEKAVALLMHDVGIANEMNYGVNGSSAYFHSSNLVKFFDYDKNIKLLYRDYCSKNEWEGILRNELAEGRPVLYSGSTKDAGHAFVCDGFNTDGLFHFNFGWGGHNNGWFACSATGFDNNQTIDYGIQRNKGGKGVPSLYSSEDFVWDSTYDCFKCRLSVRCMGLDPNTEKATVDIGLAITNVETGKVTYYIIDTVEGNDISRGTMNFNEDLPDGKYYVYPVARIHDEGWNAFFHNPYYQIVVDLTVKDGIKTWENNHIIDFVDDGTVEINGIYCKIDTKNREASVVRKNDRYNSYSGEVTIPDYVTYGGYTYPVTTIMDAFKDCENLYSVHVGNNVRVIGRRAFYGCSNLESVTLPSSLREIGSYSFRGCKKIKELVIPEGVERICSLAFNLSKFQMIVLPSSLKDMDEESFANLTCDYLHVNWTSFDNLKIGKDLFRYSYINEVILIVPKGYISLYESTAPWSDFLRIEEEGYVPIEKKWTFDASTGTLYIQGEGKMEFSANKGTWDEFKDDIKHVVIEEGIAYMPLGAFRVCKYMETISLPSTLKQIAYAAFGECYNLKELIIPEGVEYIESMAFAYTKMSKVVIPSSVKTIDAHAFGKAEIESLYVNWISLDDLDINAYAFVTFNMGETVLMVPKGCKNLYETTAPWSDFFEIVEEGNVPVKKKWTFDKTTGTLYIQGEGEMEFCVKDGIWDEFKNDIKHVVIAEGVSTVAPEAFSECITLESISLPSTIKSIGEMAFVNCCKLQELEIPEGIELLKYASIWGCSHLKKLVIPSTVKDISSNVFSYAHVETMYVNWTSLDDISIDSKVFEHGYMASTVLIVPKGCTSLYESTAPWSNFLKIVEEGYVPIEKKWTFDDTTGTLNIQGEGEMQFIAENGIWDEFKYDIKHVVIEEGTTFISDLAFFTCQNIESVTLPSTLTTVTYADFWGCERLNKIECAATNAPSVGDEAFANVSPTGTLIVPEGSDYSSWLEVLPAGWGVQYAQPDGVTPIMSSTESEAIYDLSGRRIDHPRAKGIYIKGGKKYVNGL